MIPKNMKTQSNKMETHAANLQASSGTNRKIVFP